jgi:hypothetical protein
MRSPNAAVLSVILAALLAAPFSPPGETKSTNPCSDCHATRYMYLDILEGDSGQSIPASVDLNQSANVTVVVKVEGNTTKNNVMSSIKVTLASKNGYFSVNSTYYNISSITAGNTAKASWQIKGVSAGNDTMYINATGTNNHQSLSFSDSYSPSPSITVNSTSNGTNTAPSLSLTGPSAGADLSGGSVFRLNWTASDNDLAGCKVSLFYSTDGFGSSNTTIATNLSASPSAYNWTLPRINSTTVALKGMIKDSGNLSGESASLSNFTVDTALPSVSSASPANGTSGASVGASIVVNFSEPMNRSSAEAAFSMSPSPGAFNWSWDLNSTSMTGTHADLSAGTQYNCSVANFNDSSSPGNQNTTKYAWSFTTASNNPPSITLSGPAPGADLSGGSSVTIGWNASDENLASCTVSLFYSTDGFSSSNTSIASSLAASAGSFNLTLPMVNSTTVRVKGIIQDSLKQTGEGLTSNFTIDSAPPAVIKVSPPAGGHNESNAAIITITFSEAVNTTTALGGFSISPDPGGFSWSWNSEKTAATGTHNTLNDSTTYTCKISGMTDLSTPGNTNKTVFSWDFTTSAVPVPSIALSDPTGGEIYYWGERITALWTAAGGTGNLSINVSMSQNGAAGPFQSVAASLPNSGSYSFDVPQAVSNSCLIRVTVRDAKGMETNDTSTAVFSIANLPSVSASFKASNVTYTGDIVSVSWNGTVGYGSLGVSLYLGSADSGARTLIASGLPSSGTFNWTASGLPDERARLVLNATDQNGRSVENLSAPFPLASALRIAGGFPQGPVVYSGDRVDVSWSLSGGYRNVTLSLLLRAGSGPDRVLASNLSSNGTFGWTAPDMEAEGAVLALSASDEGRASAENLSAPFAIARALRLSATFSHGAVVYAGDRVLLCWSHAGGYRNVAVSVSLRTGAGPDQVIGSNLAPDGSLDWTVPVTDIDGAVLVVSASDEGGRTAENASAPFPLARPPALQASFAAAAVVYSGESVPAGWSRTGGYHDVTVTLWLRNGASADQLVGTDSAASGSLIWTAPDLSFDGSRLVLVATDQGGRTAECASAPFSLARALGLRAAFPAAAIVYSGETLDVGWERSGGYRDVSVALALRAGAGPDIPAGAAGVAIGILQWTVPELEADNARLVMVATDAAGRSVENASAPFTIARAIRIAADLTVGPVAYSGGTAPLSWNCTGGYGEVIVSLEYRVSPGAPATRLATGLHRYGSLSWTAPASPADNAALVLTATDGNGRSAVNASRTFAVAPPLSLSASFPVDGVVAAGSVVEVRWNAAGGFGKVSVSLLLRRWGEPGDGTLASGLSAAGVWGWPAPGENLSAVQLVLLAKDSGGMSEEAVSAPFAVRPAGPSTGNPPPDQPSLNALPSIGWILPDTRVFVDTPVAFDASSSYDPEGAPLRFNWDFGDGSTPVANGSAVLVHIFGKPGRYPVTLSVSDGRDSVNRTLVMNVVPGPSSPASGSNGFTIPAGFWALMGLLALLGAGLYYARLENRGGRGGMGAPPAPPGPAGENAVPKPPASDGEGRVRPPSNAMESAT